MKRTAIIYTIVALIITLTAIFHSSFTLAIAHILRNVRSPIAGTMSFVSTPDLEARIVVCQEENRNLRALLKLSAPQNFTLVTANVLGKVTLAGRQEIIIDRGSDDGMIERALVVDDAGNALGTIESVQRHNALVLPIEAEGSKLTAVTVGATMASGLVEGELGLSARMNYLDRNADIAAQTPVVTAGLEEVIVQGVPIGRIAEITTDPKELFSSAVLELPARPQFWNSVVVMIPHVVSTQQ